MIIPFVLCILLSACGAAPEGAQVSQPVDGPSESAQPVSEVSEKPTYDDVIAIFEGVYPDLTISVSSLKTRLEVHLVADLSPDAAPDDWVDILERLTAALAEAPPVAEKYGVQNISAQIETADGIILANGLNGTLTYDVFAEKSNEDAVNPPTISKAEYDQIAIGMTLSKVRDIVGGGGTLDSEYGESGGVSRIKTYKWTENYIKRRN